MSRQRYNKYNKKSNNILIDDDVEIQLQKDLEQRIMEKAKRRERIKNERKYKQKKRRR